MRDLPFQAVIFDLDDTMLRDDLTISDDSISTLRRLASRGVHIIPASGRAQLSMKSYVDRMDCASLYIACNGAEIWDGKTGKLLHSETFSTEVGRKIASFGKEHHCYTQTYEGPCFYYNEESVWARRYAEASSLTGVYVGDLEKYITQPRSKILMMDDEAKIAAMLKEARERFRGLASVTCSKPWFLEFNPPRATKGIALQTACSLLQIRIGRTLAFGDSLNDLSMLQAAGRGVLMENGRQELRPLCDDICSSNQDDGVAGYLKSVFREELS